MCAALLSRLIGSEEFCVAEGSLVRVGGSELAQLVALSHSHVQSVIQLREKFTASSSGNCGLPADFPGLAAL